MKRANLEFGVGLFLAAGALCLAWLSVKIARNEFFASSGYEVRARFSNCGGLRPGSPVVVAGVEVGRVARITLDDYEANVSMMVQRGLVLQKDVIASIKTKGLIGEKFVELTPGADDEKIPPGGVIHSTEPALDFESLIAKYIHGSVAAPAK